MSSEYTRRLIHRADVTILRALWHLEALGWPDTTIRAIVQASFGLGAVADEDSRLPPITHSYLARLQLRDVEPTQWADVLRAVQANPQTARAIVDLCEYYWMGAPQLKSYDGP